MRSTVDERVAYPFVPFRSPDSPITGSPDLGALRVPTPPPSTLTRIPKDLFAVIPTHPRLAWVSGVLPFRSPDSPITGSPDHRITRSPDHPITGSPDHQIIGSPDHRFGVVAWFGQKPRAKSQRLIANCYLLAALFSKTVHRITFSALERIPNFTICSLYSQGEFRRNFTSLSIAALW
jgi:hypothetical protein